MNTQEPHDIRPWHEIAAEGLAWHFVPLTEEERAELEPKSVEERSAWLKANEEILEERKPDLREGDLLRATANMRSVPRDPSPNELEDFHRGLRAQAQAKFPSSMTPREAVYGVLVWLTTRNDTTTLGEKYNAAPAAERAEEFCKDHNLA